MSLMVEKETRGGTCHAIHIHVDANNKWMKDYDPNKESSCLKYWDVSNLYGCAILPDLPPNNFQWTNDKFNLYTNFIRNHDEDCDKGYMLKVDVKHPEKLHKLHNHMLFLPDKWKIINVKNLYVVFTIKKSMSYT